MSKYTRKMNAENFRIGDEIYLPLTDRWGIITGIIHVGRREMEVSIETPDRHTLFAVFTITAPDFAFPGTATIRREH